MPIAPNNMMSPRERSRLTPQLKTPEARESPAPCAEHAARLIVPDHQPVWAVELLHPHDRDEKNGDEDRRRDRVGIFAPKFVRHPMVDRLGASRTGENQRKVDAKSSRRDRPIGDWQAPSASAGEECSAPWPGEPGRRFWRDLSLGRHLRLSQFIGDRRPMARQSSHVPSPRLMNSVTTVNCALAAAHGPRAQRRRPRPVFDRAAIDAAHFKRISIQDKSSWV